MQVSSLSYREWVGVGGRSKTGGTFEWSADLFRGQALSLIENTHPDLPQVNVLFKPNIQLSYYYSSVQRTLLFLLKQAESYNYTIAHLETASRYQSHSKT